MKNSRKNRKNRRKLVSLIFIVLILLIGFVACLKLNDNDKDKDDAKNKTDEINKTDDNKGINDSIDKFGKGGSESNDRACATNDDKSNDDKSSAGSEDKNTDNTGSSDPKDEEKPETIETFLDENSFVTNSDSIEVVVNKERSLKETYVPEDLVKITDVPTLLASKEVNQLRKPAAEALTKLVEAAKEEIKIQLHARSGYRSYRTQESTYNGYVKSYGQAEADKFSAKAGQSEHQTGLSMDISSESVNYLLNEEFGDTEEGKWVAENAHRFGFIIRYPKGKEDITGYQYEPWHLRYLGEDLATKVYESGLTLEQYFFDNDKEQ
jgi:D-alanyl-D-alanine carboxypeptidase